MKNLLKVFLSPLKFDENVMEVEIGKSENDSLQSLCHIQNMKDGKGKGDQKREEIILKRMKERKWPWYRKKETKWLRKEGEENLKETCEAAK